MAEYRHSALAVARKGEEIKMEVIGYATKSVRGFEKMETSQDFSLQMKQLQSKNIKFMPFVLVQNMPGSKKEKDWLPLNEFRKISKRR